MPATRRTNTDTLVDAVSGAVVGLMGSDGREYLVPTTLALTPTATVAISGTPISGGTINNCSIGATTRSTGAFTALAVTRTDSSGTPGNVTNNSALGRVAIAAAASSVVVTNSTVTATSDVFVNLISTDATLTSARVTSIGAGTFTITGNAAATAAATVSFLVVN